MRRILVVAALAAACRSAAPQAATTGPASKRGWAAATAGARRVAGLFPLHVRPDGAVLLEIAAAQLERDYGLALHLEKGVEPALFFAAGTPIEDTMLVRFHRVGDHVAVLRRSDMYVSTDPARSDLVDRAAGPAVLAMLAIAAQRPDGRLLVKLNRFLLSDLADFQRRLRELYGEQAPIAFEPTLSYVDRAGAYARNVDFSVVHTFRTETVPPLGGAALVSPRQPSIALRVSLFALPERPMTPRQADDRVGFQTRLYKDVGGGAAAGRDIASVIVRRRLERRADGTAVEPITYYIDPSVPEELRPYVREGVLAWNRALAAAGLKDAIRVADAASDPAYRSDDIRYSSIVWTPGYAASWAFGGSHVDPRTGEILNTDILLGSEFVRVWHQPPWLATSDPAGRCAAARHMAREMAVAGPLLAAAGVLTPGRAMPPELVGAAVRALVMHEVGHALGLRHNFRGSLGVPVERLDDPGYIARHGLTSSVMDYPGLNLSDGPRLAPIFEEDIGVYDVWAIRYGYTPFATREAERAGLAALAAESTRAGHDHADDDDEPWVAPVADPTTNRGDLGADPLEFNRRRIGLVDRALPRLAGRLVADGGSYSDLRAGVSVLLTERKERAVATAEWIGGVIAARDHRGQKDRRPAVRPVPATDQRRAMRLLADSVFADGAFAVPPDVLADLAPYRGATFDPTAGDRAGVPSEAIHYPLHAITRSAQVAVLDALFEPSRLQRLVDAAGLPAADRYRIEDLFADLDAAIWRHPATSAARRALQLAYIDHLAALVQAAEPPPPPPRVGLVWLREIATPLPVRVPDDARALARAGLEQILSRASAGLRRGRLDTMTRAHLGEARARARRALRDPTSAAPR